MTIASCPHSRSSVRGSRLRTGAELKSRSPVRATITVPLPVGAGTVTSRIWPLAVCMPTSQGSGRSLPIAGGELPLFVHLPPPAVNRSGAGAIGTATPQRVQPGVCVAISGRPKNVLVRRRVRSSGDGSRHAAKQLTILLDFLSVIGRVPISNRVGRQSEVRDGRQGHRATRSQGRLDRCLRLGACSGSTGFAGGLVATPWPVRSGCASRRSTSTSTRSTRCTTRCFADGKPATAGAARRAHAPPEDPRAALKKFRERVRGVSRSRDPARCELLFQRHVPGLHSIARVRTRLAEEVLVLTAKVMNEAGVTHQGRHRTAWSPWVGGLMEGAAEQRPGRQTVWTRPPQSSSSIFTSMTPSKGAKRR